MRSFHPVKKTRHYKCVDINETDFMLVCLYQETQPKIYPDVVICHQWNPNMHVISPLPSRLLLLWVCTASYRAHSLRVTLDVRHSFGNIIHVNIVIEHRLQAGSRRDYSGTCLVEGSPCYLDVDDMS